MTRYVLMAAMAVTLAVATASTASAQFFIQPYPYRVPYPSPYSFWRNVPPQINPFVPYVPWNNGAVIQPWPRTAQFPVIGTLPNGIQIINPWGPRINPYYASNFVNYYGNYYGGYNPYGYGYNPYGFNPYGYNPYGNGNGIVIQAAFGNPQRNFITDVNAAAAIMNGGQFRQVANMTHDGLAPRLPATGSITAFGAIDPATGQYVNPVSGMTNVATPSLTNSK